MNRPRRIKKSRGAVKIDLNKIPISKQDHTYVRNGYTIIGHQDMICFCTVCKEWKSQRDFHLSHTDSYGRKKIRSQCRDCQNENVYKTIALSKNKNLPPKPDKCPICLEPNKKLELDHCHITGLFRGWLCRTCNTASGRFKDSVEVIKRLLQYHLDFLKKIN